MILHIMHGELKKGIEMSSQPNPNVNSNPIIQELVMEDIIPLHFKLALEVEIHKQLME